MTLLLIFSSCMNSFAATKEGKAIKAYLEQNGSAREKKKIASFKNQNDGKNTPNNNSANDKNVTTIYRYKDGAGNYQYFKNQDKSGSIPASSAEQQVNQGSAKFVDITESVDDLDMYDLLITESDGVIEYSLVLKENTSEDTQLKEELSEFESIFGTVLEEENDTDPEVAELQAMFNEI